MSKKTILLLGAALAFPAAAMAQAGSKLPVSRTAGIQRLVLPPAQLSLVSLPMVERVVDSGTVTAGPTTTIGVSTTTLSDLTSLPHSIQILSGAALGTRVRITGSTASSVTVGAAIAGLAEGDQYMIVPDDTLASVFGPTNAVGLRGGSGAALADEIYIQINGTLTGFFYKNAGLGTNGWKRIATPGAPPEPNAPIDPLTGVYVIRKAGGNPVNLDLTGYTVNGRQKPKVVAGFNILSNPFTLPTTLGKSNLKDFITGGAGAGTSDLVYLEEGGVLTGYFYKDRGLGGTGWRRADNAGGANQDSVVLTPGKAILFREQAGTASFTLQEPFTD